MALSLVPIFSSAASLENFAKAALRSPFSVMRIALATSFLNVFWTHASSVGETTSSGYSRLALPAFFCSWLIAVTIFLTARMPELDRAEEVFLGDFVAAAFDHHHAVERAGDDDVHAAAFIFGQRGVDDVLAVLIAADAHGGDVLRERDVGNGERRTGRAHGEDVGVEFGDRSTAPSSRS